MSNIFQLVKEHYDILFIFLTILIGTLFGIFFNPSFGLVIGYKYK